MITLKADTGPAVAYLRLIAGGLTPTINESIDAVLTAALQALEARTPVRTGHMQASWFLEHDGPGQWAFGDAADYASYVVDGTSRQQRNEALHAELDDIETVLTDALGATLTRYLGAAG